MLFAAADVITIDLAGAATIGTAIAGAIVAHAKLIVGYLERKDAEHRKNVEDLREDSRLMAATFRQESADARDQYRAMVDVLIRRADEQDGKIARMREKMGESR